MKKVLALLLALMMVFGLLAGCTDSGEEATNDPTAAPTSGSDPTSAPTAPPAPSGDEIPAFELPITEDDITFEWWHQDSYSFEGYSSTEDSLFWKWMEEQTGVTIDFVNPAAGSEAESFQTMVLSGDASDFISYIQRYYSGGVDKAISDGFLLRLNEVAEQYMPNYLAQVYRDEDTFMQCVSDTGNLWGVHCILDRPQGSWIGTGIRGDWLEDAGMTVADVETIDGLETALTAFKDYTADGEGPYFISSGSGTYSGSMTGSWNVMGVSFMPFLNKDGTAVYSALEPSYKDYIAKMADWYAKGLVNKNYVAENAWNTPDDYWANGRVGVGDVMYASLAQLASINATSENPDPDFDIVGIPTPKLDASQDWATDFHVRESFTVVRANNSLGVTTYCDNIEVALKFLDYIWTEEGIIASNWGPYGGEIGDTNTSYFIDETDANGDGHIEAYQPWLIEKYGNITYFMAVYTIHNGPQLYIWDREFTSLTQKEVDTANTWDIPGSDWLWPDGVTMTAEEGEEASGIVTSANSYVVTWSAEVITGEKSIDTYETELLPNLESVNIQRAIDIRQAALSRYYDRLQFMEE